MFMFVQADSSLKGRKIFSLNSINIQYVTLAKLHIVLVMFCYMYGVQGTCLSPKDLTSSANFTCQNKHGF